LEPDALSTMADVALIASAVVLSIVCLVCALVVTRLLVPNAQQRARLRAERIERLFCDHGSGEVAGV